MELELAWATMLVWASVGCLFTTAGARVLVAVLLVVVELVVVGLTSGGVHAEPWTMLEIVVLETNEDAVLLLLIVVKGPVSV